MGCSGAICAGTSAAAVWGSITTAGPFWVGGGRLAERVQWRRMVSAVEVALALSLVQALAALTLPGL